MGGFALGGLSSGLDTNALISQLIQLERRPILRVNSRIRTLETQKEGISSLRTKLLDLRNLIKDFQIGLEFNRFAALSSNESALTAEPTGANPTTGSFLIDVVQLASATIGSSSSVLGAAINPAATFDASGIGTGVTAGTFSINGTEFTVDPAVQSLNGILAIINGSGAGVTATYDAVSDTVTLENATPGDTSIINFGASSDTSNLIEALRLNGATQTTGGAGSTVVTSRGNLGSVNPGFTLNTVSFGGGAVTAGSFTINGITIVVDPTADSISDITDRINSSDAGVAASYDATTDSIRVVSETLGSRTISFASGTSNFLDVTNLTTAIQTAGSDSQFTVNGGAVQTQNTNTVQGAIGGVTLSLLSVGSSTISIDVDDDAIIEVIQGFVDTFNESLSEIQGLVKEGGVFGNDGSIRSIESFLRSNVFAQVTGLSAGIESLIDIGISTGSGFSAESGFKLSLDVDVLREKILNNRSDVVSLFSNDAETGIADLMFDFLDEITSTTGYLNDRSRASGTIDDQIDSLNDRIEALERRVAQKETRLRRQFLQLEVLTSSLQAQGAALAGLSGGFARL